MQIELTTQELIDINSALIIAVPEFLSEILPRIEELRIKISHAAGLATYVEKYRPAVTAKEGQ